MTNFPKRMHKTWLYWMLGLFTIVYVSLQLVQFHCQLPNIPHELRLFWMATLLGYVAIKEAFRWFSLEDGLTGHWGEFYVLLVVSSFLWMEGWNIVRLWICGTNCLIIPEGAIEGAVEALALWVISMMSSLWHHNKRNGNNNKLA